jgi:hypothetical protein
MAAVLILVLFILQSPVDTVEPFVRGRPCRLGEPRAGMPPGNQNADCGHGPQASPEGKPRLRNAKGLCLKVNGTIPNEKSPEMGPNRRFVAQRGPQRADSGRCG